ncbi:ABC transporter substrate-binding protein [Ferviditalea candida]|uniref:ABC transporter substrate-binding protein n=1 Tax=Ferviditalea candida TaxID=3108399 RepID=A0ABU5ZNI1_9BACL|nr:ABC transporter substrate-binding protein [Paenibacillaceae bacterium T2]
MKKEEEKYSRREFLKRAGVYSGAMILGPTLLSACGLDKKSGTPSPSASAGGSSAAPAAAGGSKKTIKIGLLEPYSGPYAVSGTSEKQGAEIAMKEINDAGGIWGGYQIEYVTEDDQTKPNVGAEKARKLVEKDNVDILVGCVSSGVGLAVSAYAQQAGIPYVGTGIHSDELTGAKVNKLFFRSTISNLMSARATGKFLLDSGKKWYFITSDYSWGWSGEAAFMGVLKEAGGQVIGVDRIALGSTDYSSQLTKAKSSGADVLIMSLYGSDLVNALKQFGQFGMIDKMMVGGPLNGTEIASGLSDAENVGYWGMPWAPDNGAPRATDFAKKITDTYKTTINWRHWCGYNGTIAAIKAIEAAGTTEAAAVVKAFESLKWDGLKKSDVVMRDWDHQALQEVFVGQAIPKKDWAYDGQYFKVVGTGDGAKLAASKEENKDAIEVLSKQTIPARANYSPVAKA